jgi:uncharacterized membrane protein
VPKSRLEAFSDAVIAIILTIMVLELRVPPDTHWSSLRPVLPTFLTYVLSFVNLGIYWNNHHHLLHSAKRVTGGVLWANLHLLFWLSLFPFATGWLGEHHIAKAPTIFYGAILLLAAIAYYILQSVILRAEGPDSHLAEALGRDLKGKASPIIYVVAILLALVSPLPAIVLYVLVALMWLIPDRRLERRPATGG